MENQELLQKLIAGSESETVEFKIAFDKEVIQIKEFPIKPVSLKGRYYRRVSNSNRVMSMPEIAQMHLDSTSMSWDKLPAKDAMLDHIDFDRVKRYINKANETGRRKIADNENSQQVLEKLELIKDGRPTWAAVLLFRKEPQRFLSQAVIHCGRFKEETIVIDDRMIHGDLTEQIDEAMDFIRKNKRERKDYELRNIARYLRLPIEPHLEIFPNLLIKNVFKKVGTTGRKSEYLLNPTNPP